MENDASSTYRSNNLNDDPTPPITQPEESSTDQTMAEIHALQLEELKAKAEQNREKKRRQKTDEKQPMDVDKNNNNNDTDDTNTPPTTLKPTMMVNPANNNQAEEQQCPENDAATVIQTNTSPPATTINRESRLAANTVWQRSTTFSPTKSTAATKVSNSASDLPTSKQSTAT